MKFKILHNCMLEYKIYLRLIRACSCYNKLWHIQYMIPMQNSAAYAQRVTALIIVVLKNRNLTEQQVQELAQSVKISLAVKQRKRKQNMQQPKVAEQDLDVEEDTDQVMQPEVAVESEVRQKPRQQETRKTTGVEKKSKVQRFVDTVSKIPFIYDIARISAFTAATLALLLTGSEPQGHALV